MWLAKSSSAIHIWIRCISSHSLISLYLNRVVMVLAFSLLIPLCEDVLLVWWIVVCILVLGLYWLVLTFLVLSMLAVSVLSAQSLKTCIVSYWVCLTHSCHGHASHSFSYIIVKSSLINWDSVVCSSLLCLPFQFLNSSWRLSVLGH